MANLRDWYYAQIVTQAQMDEAFGWLESADHAIAEDNALTGIVAGLTVSQTAPASMSVAVAGPGLAYDKDGNRSAIASASSTLDCSVDEFGVSTAVSLAGREKYLGVFVRFKRRMTDAEIDGAGLQVYTRRWEDAEVFVRQGAEATVPTASRVALLTDAVLLGDVRLVYGTTSVLNAAITVTRREDWSRVVTTNFGTMVAGTAKDAVTALWAAVDSAAGGSGPFTFAENWFGAVPVGGTATVAGALNEIVKDLAAPTGGASYIAAADFTSTYVSWASQPIQGALAAIGAAVNGHIGGGAPQHPASSITFTPYSYLTAVTTQAAIQELVADLASTTGGGVSGASRIGAQTQAGTLRTLTGGTLLSQLAYLLTQLDYINLDTQRVIGDWSMTGRVAQRVTETCRWDKRIATYPSRALNRNYSNAFPAMHYPGKNAVSLGTAHLCEIVPMLGNDAAGNRIFGVGVGALGQYLFWFDPGALEDGVVQVAITGLSTGVTEVTAACSDGLSVYVLVRRTAFLDDTVAKINPTTGVVAWEQSLVSVNSLGGYPFDRIIVGDEIISASPLTVSLIILNGAVACDSTGVIQKKRSDTGGTYGWGNKHGGASVTGRTPTGGLALVTNDTGSEGTVGFTTSSAVGTLIPRLALVNDITGSALTPVDMASGGTLAVDEAFDLVSDGAAFWWVSYDGHIRFSMMPDADVLGAVKVTYVGDDFTVINNGFSLCFDGQRLWVPTFDSTEHWVKIMTKVAARLSWDDAFKNNPQTAIIMTNTGDAWTPFAPNWEMGRTACLGPHVVTFMTRPAGTTRNWVMVVRDVHTRHAL